MCFFAQSEAMGKRSSFAAELADLGSLLPTSPQTGAVLAALLC